MAVADELACGEHRWNELGAEDERIQTALKQADHVRATVALEAAGFLIDAAELPLGDIPVVATQLLLGLELHAVVGELALAPLAVLAGAVLTPVHRALRSSPDVLAHPAVDLVLGFHALGHSRPRLSLLLLRIAPSSVPAGPEPTGKTSLSARSCRGSRNARQDINPPGARVLGANRLGVKLRNRVGTRRWEACRGPFQPHVLAVRTGPSGSHEAAMSD